MPLDPEKEILRKIRKERTSFIPDEIKPEGFTLPSRMPGPEPGPSQVKLPERRFRRGVSVPFAPPVPRTGGAPKPPRIRPTEPVPGIHTGLASPEDVRRSLAKGVIDEFLAQDYGNFRDTHSAGLLSPIVGDIPLIGPFLDYAFSPDTSSVDLLRQITFNYGAQALNWIAKLPERLFLAPAIAGARDPVQWWFDQALKEPRPLMQHPDTGEMGYWFITPSGWNFHTPEELGQFGAPPIEAIRNDPRLMPGTGELYSERVYNWNRIITKPDGTVDWERLIGKIDPSETSMHESFLNATGLSGISLSLLLEPEKINELTRGLDEGMTVNQAIETFQNPWAEFAFNTATDPLNLLPPAIAQPIVEALFPPSILLTRGAPRLLRRLQYTEAVLRYKAFFGEDGSYRKWFINLSKKSKHTRYTDEIDDVLRTVALRYQDEAGMSVQDYFQQVLLDAQYGGATVGPEVLGPNQLNALSDATQLLYDKGILAMDDLLEKYGVFAEIPIEGRTVVVQHILENAEDPATMARYISSAISDQVAKELGIRAPARRSVYRFLNWTGRLLKENWLMLNPRYMAANMSDNVVKTTVSGYAPTFDLSAHEKIATYLQESHGVVLPNNTVQSIVADALDLNDFPDLATGMLPWPLGTPEGMAQGLRSMYTWLTGSSLPAGATRWLEGENLLAKLMRGVNYTRLGRAGFNLSSMIERSQRAQIFVQAFENYLEKNVKGPMIERLLADPDLAELGAWMQSGRIKGPGTFDNFIRSRVGGRPDEFPPEALLSDLAPSGTPNNAYIGELRNRLDRIQEQLKDTPGLRRAVTDAFDQALRSAIKLWQESADAILKQSKLPEEELAEFVGSAAIARLPGVEDYASETLLELQERFAELDDVDRLREDFADFATIADPAYIQKQIGKALAGVPPDNVVYASLFEEIDEEGNITELTGDALRERARELNQLTPEEIHARALQAYNDIYRQGLPPLGQAFAIPRDRATPALLDETIGDSITGILPSERVPPELQPGFTEDARTLDPDISFVDLATDFMSDEVSPTEAVRLALSDRGLVPPTGVNEDAFAELLLQVHSGDFVLATWTNNPTVDQLSGSLQQLYEMFNWWHGVKDVIPISREEYRKIARWLMDSFDLSFQPESGGYAGTLELYRRYYAPSADAFIDEGLDEAIRRQKSLSEIEISTDIGEFRVPADIDVSKWNDVIYEKVQEVIEMTGGLAAMAWDRVTGRWAVGEEHDFAIYDLFEGFPQRQLSPEELETLSPGGLEPIQEYVLFDIFKGYPDPNMKRYEGKVVLSLHSVPGDTMSPEAAQILIDNGFDPGMPVVKTRRTGGTPIHLGTLSQVAGGITPRHLVGMKLASRSRVRANPDALQNMLDKAEEGQAVRFVVTDEGLVVGELGMLHDEIIDSYAGSIGSTYLDVIDDLEPGYIIKGGNLLGLEGMMSPEKVVEQIGHLLSPDTIVLSARKAVGTVRDILGLPAADPAPRRIRVRNSDTGQIEDIDQIFALDAVKNMMYSRFVYNPRTGQVMVGSIDEPHITIGHLKYAPAEEWLEVIIEKGDYLIYSDFATPQSEAEDARKLARLLDAIGMPPETKIYTQEQVFRLGSLVDVRYVDTGAGRFRVPAGIDVAQWNTQIRTKLRAAMESAAGDLDRAAMVWESVTGRWSAAPHHEEAISDLVEGFERRLFDAQEAAEAGVALPRAVAGGTEDIHEYVFFRARSIFGDPVLDRFDGEFVISLHSDVVDTMTSEAAQALLQNGFDPDLPVLKADWSGGPSKYIGTLQEVFESEGPLLPEAAPPVVRVWNREIGDYQNFNQLSIYDFVVNTGQVRFVYNPGTGQVIIGDFEEPHGVIQYKKYASENEWLFVTKDAEYQLYAGADVDRPEYLQRFARFLKDIGEPSNRLLNGQPLSEFVDVHTVDPPIKIEFILSTTRDVPQTSEMWNNGFIGSYDEFSNRLVITDSMVEHTTVRMDTDMPGIGGTGQLDIRAWSGEITVWVGTRGRIQGTVEDLLRKIFSQLPEPTADIEIGFWDWQDWVEDMKAAVPKKEIMYSELMEGEDAASRISKFPTVQDFSVGVKPMWERVFRLRLAGESSGRRPLIGIYTTDGRLIWSVKEIAHGPLFAYAGIGRGDLNVVTWMHLDNGQLVGSTPGFWTAVTWVSIMLEHGAPPGMPVRIVLTQEDPVWVERLGERRIWNGSLGEFVGMDLTPQEMHTDTMAAVWDDALIQWRETMLQNSLDDINSIIESLNGWRDSAVGAIESGIQTRYMSAQERERVTDKVSGMKEEWIAGLEKASFEGSAEVNRILFDYSARGNWEEILRQYGPFTTWQLRNPMFWAQAFAQRPNLISAMLRFLHATEIERRKKNLTQRFEGTVGGEVGADNMLGLPPGHYAVKPTPIISLFSQFQEPFEPPEAPPPPNKMAEYLQQFMQFGSRVGINPWPWIEYPLEKIGAAPPGSTDISFGPQQRAIEMALRELGYLEPGQTLTGDSTTGRWLNDYYVNRMIGEMFAAGDITEAEFLDGLKNPESPVWSQAQERVSEVQTILGVAGLFSPFQIKMATRGEVELREQAAVRSDQVDPEIREWFSIQYPYLSTYTFIFGEEVRLETARVFFRYEEQLEGLHPWEPGYRNLVAQRSAELDALLGPQESVDVLMQEYVANPVVVGQENQFGQISTLETARWDVLHRLYDVMPRAYQFADENGKIDWDTWDGELDRFYSQIGALSTSFGYQLNLMDFMRFRYRNAAPDRIAFDLYKDYINQAWDVYDGVQTGGTLFQETLLWAVEQQYLKDIEAGFTPLEAGVLRAENMKRWNREGLPFDYRNKLIEPYEKPVNLQRFGPAVATLMDLSISEVVDDQSFWLNLNYELPGMFGERSMLDLATDDIFDYYYGSLTPAEQSVVRRELGMEEGFQVPEDPVETMMLWYKIQREERPRILIQNGIITHYIPPTMPDLPIYSELTPEEQAGLEQARVDMYRYTKAREAGVSGTWTETLTEYFSDEGTPVGEFWAALNGVFLSSAAFDDPVIGPFLSRATRSILEPTDEQYAKALEYFNEHRSDLIDEERTQEILDHPDWYERAQQERAQFDRFKILELEVMKGIYYSVPWGDARSEWEEDHPDDWARLEEYMDLERARSLRYPYYAYFFHQYDWGQYYGSGTKPNEVGEGTAPALSDDYEQAISDMNDYINGIGTWTDPMRRFYGPPPLGSQESQNFQVSQAEQLQYGETDGPYYTIHTDDMLTPEAQTILSRIVNLSEFELDNVTKLGQFHPWNPPRDSDLPEYQEPAFQWRLYKEPPFQAEVIDKRNHYVARHELAHALDWQFDISSAPAFWNAVIRWKDDDDRVAWAYEYAMRGYDPEQRPWATTTEAYATLFAEFANSPNEIPVDFIPFYAHWLKLESELPEGYEPIENQFRLPLRNQFELPREPGPYPPNPIYEEEVQSQPPQEIPP